MTGVQTCALPILLSGALGGGVSTGVNALVGGADLPSAVANPLASAATAAILGKDPTMAAINSLIGQAIQAGKSGAPDTGDEVDRLLARYPAPAPAPTTASVSPEDADLIYGGASTSAAPSPAPAVGSTAGTPAPPPPDLINQLIAASVDTGTEGTSTGVNTGAPPPPPPPPPATIPQDIADQLVAAGIDTGTPGTSTGIGVGAPAPSTGLSDEELNKFLDDISTGGQFTSTGSSDIDQLLNDLAGNKPSSLSEQAKFLESNVEDQDTINKLLKDYAIDTGQLQGEYAGVGNLPEDFYVTDKGTIKSTYSGEEGYFDKTGTFVPITGGTTAKGGGTGGGTGGTGGGAPTKTATPTGTTPAQSGLDFNNLLLAYLDRKSTRLNSSHVSESRMPSSA